MIKFNFWQICVIFVRCRFWQLSDWNVFLLAKFWSYLHMILSLQSTVIFDRYHSCQKMFFLELYVELSKIHIKYYNRQTNTEYNRIFSYFTENTSKNHQNFIFLHTHKKFIHLDLYKTIKIAHFIKITYLSAFIINGIFIINDWLCIAIIIWVGW